AIALAVGVAGAVVLAHVLITVFDTQTHAAIDRAYLALPRDSYPLSQADVYAGLLWATDLANPRVQFSLVGLFALAVVLSTWLLDGPPALRRWWGWPSVIAVLAAFDLLAFAWG